MKLVRKLGLTFLCCLPVGAATSGYELNSREEISDAEEGSETNLPVETSLEVNSLETEVAEASEKKEDHVEFTSSPVDSNEAEEGKNIESKTKEENVKDISEEPKELSQIDAELESKVTVIVNAEPEEEEVSNSIGGVQIETVSDQEELKQSETIDKEQSATKKILVQKEEEQKNVEVPSMREEAKPDDTKSQVEEKSISENDTKGEQERFVASEPIKPISSPSKDSKSGSGKRFSEKEQKVRAFIGVGDGPITGNKVREGLLKLHARRWKLNAEESGMYVVLVDILSQFMKFNRMVKPL